MASRPAVIAFARAPLAGRAKTRLIPALGPEGAAGLYRCFLLDTLDGLREQPCDIVVAAAEADDVGPLAEATAALGLQAEVVVQTGADLGERLSNAVQHTLSCGHRAAVVIGTDSPDLPPSFVRRALDLVRAHDLVLGPCSDGGYYLIGLRAVIPSLFCDIAWSSGTVLSATIERATQMGLAVALLDPWCDVDAPADLQFLRERLTRQAVSGGPIPCPRTWDYLCELPEAECA